VLAAAALTAAGCGTGGPAHGGDATRGKQLFLQGANGKTPCAACHTLADAGAAGKIGPNLDDAFATDRQQGYKESGIQQVVLDQIRIPSCVAPNDPTRCMPANLVTGQDAADVSAYVAKCAGVKACNVQAAAPAGPPASSASGPAGKGQSLFSSLGCQSCHSLTGAPGVGPSLKGVFGSMVKLTNGQSVKADAAYLTESIEDPDKQIVAGFKPGVMSAAIKPHSVSMADAKALVAFLQQQK
jgi:cytochrome c oxidase subunit 2